MLLVAFSSLLSAQTGVIAVVHGRIIDGQGGPIIPDGTVLIRGKRIDAIGAASDVSMPAAVA
jgi:imidazolonepropionase-like amidohydrolase